MLKCNIRTCVHWRPGNPQNCRVQPCATLTEGEIGTGLKCSHFNLSEISQNTTAIEQDRVPDTRTIETEDIVITPEGYVGYVNWIQDDQVGIGYADSSAGNVYHV